MNELMNEQTGNQLTEKQLSEQLEQYAREMKMPVLRNDELQDIIVEATIGKWDYRRFLCVLLEKEMARRQENRKTQRIRKADFPQLKYLSELDRQELPIEGQAILPQVETLDFIREGRSMILYGNPGTGKTHIAIGLGIKACLEGYSVYFTSVPRLLTMIREAKTDRTLRALENRFEHYDLVICDEFGYVGFDKESAGLLFNHLSLRTGKKATIITTNLPFTRWEEVLKDKVLCSALVDRLCHKSYLVNMTGQSYRVKETQNLYNKR